MIHDPVIMVMLLCMCGGGSIQALKAKESLNETDVDAAVKLYYSAFKSGAKASALKI